MLLFQLVMAKDMSLKTVNEDKILNNLKSTKEDKILNNLKSTKENDRFLVTTSEYAGEIHENGKNDRKESRTTAAFKTCAVALFLFIILGGLIGMVLYQQIGEWCFQWVLDYGDYGIMVMEISFHFVIIFIIMHYRNNSFL